MAHLLEAEGTATTAGITGAWNKFVLKSCLEPFDYANIVVGFDGPTKPKIEFQYESDKVVVLYKPYSAGDYTLRVTKDGIDIRESPWSLQIHGKIDKEIHLEKIKFKGDMEHAKVNESNEVILDYSESNVTAESLKVSVEGPAFQMLKYGRPELHFTDVQDGIKRLQFKPKFAGKLKINVMFQEHHLPGSPFQVEVAQ